MPPPLLAVLALGALGADVDTAACGEGTSGLGWRGAAAGAAVAAAAAEDAAEEAPPPAGDEDAASSAAADPAICEEG